MKKNLFGIFVAVMIAIFCLPFNAAAGEGLTDTEIHIGQWAPQTGPAAPWGAVARGSDAYFKAINAQGGIHGRKIVYHYFDDGYNPAKTKAGVKQLQESNHGIFAWLGGVGSAPGMAVKDYLMDRKVLWVAPSAGSLAWVVPPQRYLFAVYPLYVVEAKGLVQYAVKTLKKKRVAIIYQNDEFGKNGLLGAKTQLESYGMKLVATIPQNVSDTDFKPHVMKMIKSKADAVIMWVMPGAAARTLGTAKAMRFSPIWMTSSVLSDYPLMFKITRGLWAGVITSAIGQPADGDHPLTAKYKKIYDKYAAKGERWGAFYTVGMSYAEPLVEGLRRAGRNLTRKTMVEAMESLKNFQGTLGKITFKKFDPKDPSTRQGQTSIFIAQCDKKAKMIKLTDWITPGFDWKTMK